MQRTILKRQAREWERVFEAHNGRRADQADRKADKDYLVIRRSLKHADHALAILGEEEDGDLSRMERLGREAHMAGLVGYHMPPSTHHHPKLDAAASRPHTPVVPPPKSPPPALGPSRANSDGSDFEARMALRDEQREHLEQTPNGKLSEATTAPAKKLQLDAKPVLGGDTVAATPREARPVTPGCFTRLVVGRPCFFAVFCLVISLALSFVAVRSGDMPTLVQRSGWSNDQSSVMLGMRAVRALRADAISPMVVGMAAESGSVAAPASGSLGDAASGDAGSGSADDVLALSQQLTSTTLIYDAHPGHSVLTGSGVSTLAAIEARVLSLPGHAEHCQRVYSSVAAAEHTCAPPNSILPVLYLNASAHAGQCARGYCAAPPSMLPNCGVSVAWGVPPCVSRVYDWRDGTLAAESEWASLLQTRLCGPMPSMRRLLLSASATCTASAMELPSVRYVRSFVPLGYPLLNWTGEVGAAGNATDRGAQWEELRSGTYINDLKVGLRAAQDEFSATSAWAKTYSTAPVDGKPLSVLWSNDASGAVNDFIIPDMMLAAASFAFVFLYVMFNLRSPFLACCGMFEIVISLPLALFVWKLLMRQSRVSWLQILSVYILLCVGADDLFVFHDTWKQSAEMPRAISADLSTRFAWTFKRAALAMLTTTATTAICLGATAASPMGQMQAFGIFTALAIIADYIMVITFFPACVVVHAKYLTPCTKRMCACGPPAAAAKVAKGGDVEAGTVVKERRSTRLLRDTCAPFLHRWRWGLIASFALIAIGAAVFVSANMTAAEELKFFSPSHPMQMMIDISANEFLGRTDWKHQATIAYGLSSPPLTYEPSVEFLRADYEAENPWAPSYVGSAAFDAAMQQRIADDCDAAAADTTLVAAGEVYCLLNALRDWNGAAFPYETSSDLHTALLSFYSSAYYADLYSTHAGYARLTAFVSTTEGASGGEVLGVYHTFNSTIPQNTRAVPAQAGPWFEAWQQFADARCGDVGCVQTLGLWSWYDVLSSLFSFAMTTTIICVCCSFVVLLIATRNVLIALYATLAIIAVIACVLCGILILGFSFGMFECIFIILTCGMAIDYAVHLAHFYQHADGTRQQRTTSALHGVGLSILGGAVTTMGAGAPQFLCQILFFRLNGTFIFLTSGFALAFSFGLLLPLLMAIGPEGQQGEICAWRGQSRARVREVARM